MNELSLSDLLDEFASYDKKNKKIVEKAYYFAQRHHLGQKRQSGEDYIIHPLNVAYTLTLMRADVDTVCAGLLHDIIEDTIITRDEITSLFNSEVTKLVSGVTKINHMNLLNNEEVVFENTRKIITSLNEDVRIIVIKLADRLHNMQTMDFKPVYKQEKHAKETMNIFVPLAYQIGLYDMKKNLEDLSFKYLNKKKFLEIESKKKKIIDSRRKKINETINRISKKLNQNDMVVSNDICDLGLYSIYKRLKKNFKFEEIHNLFSVVILVENESDCYKALGLIHSLYHPVNHKFKDYISTPKTTMYKSLHTTIFIADGTLLQIQIRTNLMNNVAKFGVVASWHNKNNNNLQKNLLNNFCFQKDISDLDKSFNNNREFLNLINKEILNEKIYTYTPSGSIIELPKNSTVIDFAYKLHTDIGDKMVSALVNNYPVSIKYVLKNKDRVKIITDDDYLDKSDWIDIAYTSYAKRNIREFQKKLHS